MLPAAPIAVVRFGEFTFDRGTRLLRRGTEEIPLPPRVLGVLELLLDRAGDVVARQVIIDTVWKDAFVTDTSLAEAVSFLRQALGDDPQAPTYIQTVHRRGYRFVAALSGAAVPGPSAAPAPDDATVKPAIGGELVPWSIATLCAVAAIVAIWQLTHREIAAPPIVRILIEPSPGTVLDTRAPSLAISPDGHRVVFAACTEGRCRLYLREIDRLSNVELPGTDDGSAPFFSPDGRWVGFFSDGKLKKMALPGGTPVALADAPHAFGAAWLPDSTIVFADSAFGGLKQVSDSGGTAVVFTEPAAGELGHAWPAVLPDGRAIVFTASTSPLETGGTLVLVPYESNGSRNGRTARVLAGAADSGRAVSPEYVAYTRRGDLYAVPFDPIRLTAAGREQPVVERVAPRQFAVSASGALVHAPIGGPIPDSSVFAVGSDRRMPIYGVTHARAVSLSPDGRRIALVSVEDPASDIWVMDLERGATTRLTHGGTNVAPVWSADGTAVYYATRGKVRFAIWRRDSGATSAPVRIAASDDAHLFPSSVVGDRLVVTEARRGTSIWTMPAGGGTASVAFDSPYDDVAGVLSPDGTRLAYQSDESGRWEIYLLRLGDKHRTAISAGGGEGPFWSRDGATLYFISGQRLMAANVSGREPAAATPLATLPPHARPIGVAPDGIVRLTLDDTLQPAAAVLTLEWIRELRQLLGPPGPPQLR